MVATLSLNSSECLVGCVPVKLDILIHPRPSAETTGPPRPRTLVFGEVMNFLISGRFPTEEVWTGTVKELAALLELGTLSDKAAEFAAYDESIDEEVQSEEALSNPNIYAAVDGVRVALATIHSVKGETHDTTLVCETRYGFWYDIQEMAEFLCNPDAVRSVADYTQPKSKATNRAAFMRRLFVAMSRPRYLLCLAVKKTHLTEAQVDPAQRHFRGSPGVNSGATILSQGSPERVWRARSAVSTVRAQAAVREHRRTNLHSFVLLGHRCQLTDAVGPKLDHDTSRRMERYQFSVGVLSKWSITSISTGICPRSSLNPSCSFRAVKIDGEDELVSPS